MWSEWVFSSRAAESGRMLILLYSSLRSIVGLLFNLLPMRLNCILS